MRNLLLITLFFSLFACEQVIDLTRTSVIDMHHESSLNFVTGGVRLADGGYAVVGVDQGAPSLVVMDNDLKVRFSKQYTELAPGVFNGLEQFSNGDLVVFGSTSTTAGGQIMDDARCIAKRINLSGSEVAEYEYDFGLKEGYQSVLELENGELYLAAMRDSGFVLQHFNGEQLIKEYQDPFNLRLYPVNLAKLGDQVYVMLSSESSPGFYQAVVFPIRDSVTFFNRKILPLGVFKQFSNLKRPSDPLDLGEKLRAPRIRAIANENQSKVLFASDVLDFSSFLHSYFISEITSDSTTGPRLTLLNEKDQRFEELTEFSGGYLLSGRNATEAEGGWQANVTATDVGGVTLWSHSFGLEALAQSALTASEVGGVIEVLAYQIQNNGSMKLLRYDLDLNGDLIE